jgi:hypothetical protein
LTLVHRNDSYVCDPDSQKQYYYIFKQLITIKTHKMLEELVFKNIFRRFSIYNKKVDSFLVRIFKN